MNTAIPETREGLVRALQEAWERILALDKQVQFWREKALPKQLVNDEETDSV